MRLGILTGPGVRTTAFYIAIFMVMGAHVPFWPLWLEHWGLTPAEVGLFTALGMGVRVVAGLLIPAAADRFDRRGAAMAACLIAALVLFVAHRWIGDRALLLAATLGTGAALAGVGPLAEALGVAASRAHGFPYAQSRGLGSIGFLAANLIVGALLARLGVGFALWWIVGCLAAATVLSRGHPGGGRDVGAVPPGLREIGAMLVNPVFALFVAAVAFSQSSHSVYFALGSVHWARLGLSEAHIGGLWAASVGVEIVFMVTLGAWTIRRLGAVSALALSAAAGILRWAAMMFDPVGWALWPLQGLHAATFAVGHLGAMAFISDAVPARYGAAAQGAMGSMAVGLLLALGMAAAAALYPALGGATYGIGAAFSAVGLGLSVALARRWRGGALPD